MNSKNNEEYITRIQDILLNNNDIELKYLVNKLIEEREMYKKMALEDELTKTSNRRILRNNIKYNVVVMCDVDNFKYINDNFGHLMGDYLLEQISTKIRKNIRKTDLLCRYGGDEFAIIFKSCKVENAVMRMNAIKESLQELESTFNMPITISFGVAEYEFQKPLKDAINEADKALYESKIGGRDKITVYNSKKKIKRKYI